ncbi:MAG: hypothetical protein C5B49_07925 [Bdellovibrio sp.]|nr:MAG: hypothetical protein C5B49_07925 [Bdellovibrio sp.]
MLGRLEAQAAPPALHVGDSVVVAGAEESITEGGWSRKIFPGDKGKIKSIDTLRHSVVVTFDHGLYEEKVDIDDLYLTSGSQIIQGQKVSVGDSVYDVERSIIRGAGGELLDREVLGTIAAVNPQKDLVPIQFYNRILFVFPYNLAVTAGCENGICIGDSFTAEIEGSAVTLDDDAHLVETRSSTPVTCPYVAGLASNGKDILCRDGNGFVRELIRLRDINITSHDPSVRVTNRGTIDPDQQPAPQHDPTQDLNLMLAIWQAGGYKRQVAPPLTTRFSDVLEGENRADVSQVNCYQRGSQAKCAFNGAYPDGYSVKVVTVTGARALKLLKALLADGAWNDQQDGPLSVHIHYASCTQAVGSEYRADETPAQRTTCFLSDRRIGHKGFQY